MLGHPAALFDDDVAGNGSDPAKAIEAHLGKAHEQFTQQIARSKFPGVGNSLDALCKRFKISIEAREKHSALLDCHLLSKVYIELIDKKELTLDLMSNDKTFNEKMKMSNENRVGVVTKVSSEQMEEYKKFLKKNVSNAFALD
jgi:DNA polymerase-3 subunit epsilon